VESQHPAADALPEPPSGIRLGTHFPEALSAPLFGVLRELAHTRKQPVYVIGGFVRDFLLGNPGKDIDVVTLGSGPDLAEAFAERVGSREVAVFRNFGTALVRTDGWEVEFVGARRESYRSDSRKPIVEDGTLEEDQFRRDFTINALSLSLNEADFGALHDPFGGLQDLAEGSLRTPLEPGQTFSDDPLRMLRAARFAARLQFRIHPDTLHAMRQYAERIKIVSQERITDEFNKILLARKPSIGLNILYKTELLPYILPELARLQGVEVRDGVGHKDNFYHSLKVVDNIAPMTDELWVRWAALLHDIAKPKTKRFVPGVGWTFHGHEDLGAKWVPKIFERMRLPLDHKMKLVQKLVRLHQRPIALTSEEVTDSAIRRIVVEAGEDLERLLTLCRADITTRNPNKHSRYLANYMALEDRIREVEARDQLRNWQPPISGEDIMATFGLRPSRAVGEIKNAIREAILDGIIPNDRSAAEAYMHQIAPEIIAAG
jgi:putative nucleotidyltransferase with HDIG domain